VAEEMDSSESLHLFCVDLEGCDSVFERGVNELFSIKKTAPNDTWVEMENCSCFET
jgi:hypothetical protein